MSRGYMKRIFYLTVSAFALNMAYAAAPNLPLHLLEAESGSNFGLSLSPVQDTRIDLQREEVYINDDHTYVMTLTQEVTLLTHNGLLNNQSMASPEYYPGFTEVKLLEAYLIQPDGTKVDVPPANIFTTTSPVNPAVPGFDTALIQSVAFPQLMIGSKLHVKWEYKQVKAPDFKFADIVSPVFDTDTLRTEMSVNVPESMYVKWAMDGDFQVKEVNENGRHIISAVLGPQAAKVREPFMPADSDLLPFFEVSTIPSWSEIGDTVWKLTAATQTVTPEIEKLVKSIIGDKTGREAARALYNWTANNIFYLNIVIDPRAGIVPPPVSQILFNRFGDCKGHSSVLQTMLKVICVEAYPTLVNWDNSMTQYPLPIPNFDHEMLFIPSYNLFANPTDLYNPFGAPLEETNFYSGGLQVLADKPVMIARPKNSVLAQTPEALAEQNQYKIKSRMKMGLQGDMQAQGIMEVTGCFDGILRGFLQQGGSTTELINELAFMNGINGQAVAKSTDPANLDIPVKVEYAWEGLKVAQMSNEELLFQLPSAVDFFPASFFVRFLSSSGVRQYPLIIGAAIYEWDHEIELPVDYVTAKQPLDVNVSNPAGSYAAKYSMANGKLLVQRTLRLNKNMYMPEEFPDVAMLLIQLIQDGYSIFSFAPKPIEQFPGIPSQK
jgi:hypothetical protein